MQNALILNYDDLISFVKQFRDEGEDIAQFHSNLRQRVLILHNEWNGKAADVFYEEMASELLPALQRISFALFFCNEVLITIMKIMQRADEETAAYFKKDLDIDFGMGGFLKEPGVVDTPADVTDSPLDIPPAPEPEKPQPETALHAEGGGGASGSETNENSRGIKGDLHGMGKGVSDPTSAPQVLQSGSDSQMMPEHIGDTAKTDGETPIPNDVKENPNHINEQSFNGANAAGAGIAGAIGIAAMGGAAKITKSDDQSPPQA